MKKEISLNRIHGCLLGVAIGDALGMPVETMSHDQIMLATSGLGIVDFIDPISGRDWLVGLNAGDTTDDWQLTQTVAISLINNRGVFNLQDCANEHVKALGESTFGWGKTTQTAIESIRDGRRKVDEPLPPVEKGKGCGNGIIMKISPIAIVFEREKLWENIRALGGLTHPDIRASISAFAVAMFINNVLETSVLNTFRGLVLLNHVIDEVQKIERSEGLIDELVSERLRLIREISDPVRLRSAVGCGFYANETAAFTIGTFLRHPTDFRAGVLEAVNAGGDTDTNASIVGALIGANRGLGIIPQNWRKFSPKFEGALTLAQKLFEF